MRLRKIRVDSRIARRAAGTLLLIALGLGAAAEAASTIPEPSTGLTVTVDPQGAYAITLQNPAWTFGGSIGQPLTNLNLNTGNDNIGRYQEIVFAFYAGAAREASIRSYQNKPIVLFTTTWWTPADNRAPFPVFDTYPRTPYHLSYQQGTFAPYTFDRWGSDSPWLFFDAESNAFILSPASNFMVASTTIAAHGEIASGINAGITTLPAQFTHRTLLVVAQGINRTFEIWGQALTDLQGKIRPANDADVGLKYLGYWTDNGGTYYYRYDPARGYDGTLLAIRDYFRQEGIPLGYMQIDSWWYPKGADGHWTPGGGIHTYTAHPFVFPQGLHAFQQQLGLPLIAHARWIDPSSPYHQQYRMSNNVSVDPRYWDDIIAHLRSAGVVTYEQDWLDYNATAANTIEDQEAFMGQMARACQAHGLTMQYCMPTPRHFLQSTKYDHLTTMRVSNDRFERTKWDHFFYGARLASALGVWPWVDVFMSTEIENLLIATLSAGIVGIGDPIGSVNKANLFLAARPDGVLVKPDVPIAPIDDSIINDARGRNRPMIAATYTDHDGSKASYVFAYRRGPDPRVNFTPASLGLHGRTYVYNYVTGAGRIVEAETTFADLINDWAYYLVVPVGRSTIAFLGDAGKFVSLGKKRISRVMDDGSIEATITFAPGEDPVTLYGYAPAAPTVIALKGAAGSLLYDTSKQLFRVVVSPDADGSAIIKLFVRPVIKCWPSRKSFVCGYLRREFFPIP